MTTTEGQGGPDMPQGIRRRPGRLLVRAGAVLLGVCAALSPRYPLAQQPPSGSDAWQRQQPTRERTQDLLREQDAAASTEERRQELRTLNELHRELMPPGTTVPAPGVTPPPTSAPDQCAPRHDR
jgi:hypothetical protein